MVCKHPASEAYAYSYMVYRAAIPNMKNDINQVQQLCGLEKCQQIQDMLKYYFLTQYLKDTKKTIQSQNIYKSFKI